MTGPATIAAGPSHTAGPPGPAGWAGPTGPAASPGPAGSPTGWLAMAVGGVGAGLLAARAAGYAAPACFLRLHTGMPCPVCGLTRLAVHLGRGELGIALTKDGPGVVLFVTLAVVAVAQLVALRGRPLPWLRSRGLPGLLVVALSAHWALTALTGGIAG